MKAKREHEYWHPVAKISMIKGILRDHYRGSINQKRTIFCIAMIVAGAKPTAADIAWANSVIDKSK